MKQLLNGKRKYIIVTISILVVIILTFVIKNTLAIPVNPNFDDDNFYACVIDNLNAHNIDGINSRAYTYIATNTELAKISYLNCDNRNIGSTLGLSLMSELTQLNLSNNNLNNIDVSSNIKISNLNLANNNLSSINLNNNTNLINLYLENNNISNVDLSHNTQLSQIDINNNNLTSIDVSNNTSLIILSLNDNNLNSINVSNNIYLQVLFLDNNNLSSIDLSNNLQLDSLSIKNNNLNNIDLSNHSGLASLYLDDNNLTYIDVRNSQNLMYLGLANNNLNSLDISNHLHLGLLDFDNNLKKHLSMSVGSTEVFTSSVLIPITSEPERTISFVIDDLTVVSVNSAHIITALKAGVATITYTEGIPYSNVCSEGMLYFTGQIIVEVTGLPEEEPPEEEPPKEEPPVIDNNDTRESQPEVPNPQTKDSTANNISIAIAVITTLVFIFASYEAKKNDKFYKI